MWLFPTFASFLGGVVGLFTGMSILSVFEIIFWVARVAAAMMGVATFKRKTGAAVGEKQ